MSKKNKASSGTSLVALFTSYTWYKHNLTPRSMVNVKSRIFYYAVQPILKLLHKLSGLSLEAFLLQRHFIIDHLLEKEIEANPNTTVVEIGAGYSSRGYRMLKKYQSRGLEYLELDLPDVMQKKTEIIESLAIEHRPVILPCNFFAQTGPLSLQDIVEKHVGKDRHIVIITEGLVDYFRFSILQPVWQKIAEVIRGARSGVYLTDLTPRNDSHPCYFYIRLFERVLRLFAREPLPTNFSDDVDVQSKFAASHFSSAHVLNPTEYANILPTSAIESNPLVRIVQAQAF